jgi:hypothetical protein
VTITEKAFQQQVVDYARLRGWYVAHFRPALDSHGRWRTPMQGHPGFPDLVLVRSPRVVFAELKSDRGRTSPAQREWLDRLSHCDLAPEVGIWRPRDFDEFAERLR